MNGAFIFHLMLIVLLLQCRNLGGVCFTNYTSLELVMKCNSTTINQLYSYYYESYIHTVKIQRYGLIVEHSNFVNINKLPVPINYPSRDSFISVTDSEVRTVSSRIFESFGDMLYLNFSLNFLSDTSFLRGASVEEVILSHNKIEYLDGSSLHIRFLRRVDLSYNNIKTITTQLPRFMFLNLSHNDFINVENLASNVGFHEIIDISFNKLEKLSAEFAIKSKFMITKSNEITQCIIDGQSFELLDLSNNKIQMLEFLFINLYSLDVSNTTSKILELVKQHEEKMVTINILSLQNNNITKINSYNFQNMLIYQLDLSKNLIDVLQSKSFLKSNLPNDLYLNDNRIKQLNNSNFEGLVALKNLNLSRNPIVKVEESAFYWTTSLESLDLSHCNLNMLKKNVFRNLTALSRLDLSHNELTSLNPEIFRNLLLVDLNLSHNFLRNLPGNIFSGLNLKKLNLNFNKVLTFERNIFNNSNIANLEIEGLTFEELDINQFKGLNSLKSLNLSNCGIRILRHNAFDGLEALEFLNLEKNKIESIPKNFLSGQLNIKSLSLIGNSIFRVHQEAFSYEMILTLLNITINGELLGRRFNKLVNLNELNIVDSKITILRNNSFRGLVSLKKLNFNNSTILRIEPGAFGGLAQVTEFDFETSILNLTKLESNLFYGLSSLKYLNTSHSCIKIIEDNVFIDLQKLDKLDLSFNFITDLPKNAFRGLRDLRILDLSHNNLTGKQSTFPIGIFRDLVNLQELHLQYNKIIKFHIGEFSKLNNLRFLNLSHNHLSYLDRHLLFPLKNLNILDINSNNVIKFDYEFSIKHLKGLMMIGLGSNKWRCENLTIMLSAFEKRGVNYLDISHLEYGMENIDGIYCVYVCNYLYCPTEEDLHVTF